MSRRWADPYERLMLRLAVRDGCLTPAERARRAEQGRNRSNLRSLNNHQPAGSDARQRASKTLSRTKLPWLPIEYREEYRRLRHNMKINAPEARRLIEAQIASDLDRYRRTGELQQSPRNKSVSQ